jgi:hypothetical protein
MITQPINWPKDAPEYHSAKGWEFEKELAIKNIRNKMRDHKLSKMIERCGLLQDATIEAYDMDLFFKYHAIALYLIGRRIEGMRHA